MTPAIFALAATLGFSACGRTSQPPASRPNVILILADAMRADRLGASTPVLDSLAADSAVFRRAYAASSWTIPSVSSLFTSRYPSQHRQNKFGAVLAWDELTLADVLAEHGYATVAVSGHAVLGEGSPLGKGFQQIRNLAGPAGTSARGSSEAVNQAALGWLDGRPETARAEPFFLYLHYMETHVPYSPPAEILEDVLRRNPNIGAARERAQRAAAASSAWIPVDEELAKGMKDLYDAEVRHLDRRLGELFAALRSRGVLENALVVFTADHGEEFFEHGRYGHGASLFEEVVHVPLLMWNSSRPKHVDIDRVVSLLDVAPTLLDETGIAVPGSFEGRSLAPLIEQRQGWAGRVFEVAEGLGLSSPGESFSELYPISGSRDGQVPQRSVTRGQRKLIAQPDAQNAFDLASDPAESHPLADEAERHSLQRLLREYVARTARQRSEEKSVELDEATRERLHDLGYGD